MQEYSKCVISKWMIIKGIQMWDSKEKGERREYCARQMKVNYGQGISCTSEGEKVEKVTWEILLIFSYSSCATVKFQMIFRQLRSRDVYLVWLEPNKNLNNTYTTYYVVSESWIRLSDMIWHSEYRTSEWNCDYMMPVSEYQSQRWKCLPSPILLTLWLQVTLRREVGMGQF